MDVNQIIRHIMSDVDIWNNTEDVNVAVGIVSRIAMLYHKYQIMYFSCEFKDLNIFILRVLDAIDVSDEVIFIRDIFNDSEFNNSENHTIASCISYINDCYDICECCSLIILHNNCYMDKSHKLLLDQVRLKKASILLMSLDIMNKPYHISLGIFSNKMMLVEKSSNIFEKWWLRIPCRN